MARKGLIRNFTPLNMISEKEVHEIQQATLDVLKNTGVVIEDPDMVDLLSNAGCNIDKQANRVRFPESVVLNNLDKCPSSYTLKARDSKNDLHITSGGNTYFNASCGTKVLDLDTWETHEPSRKEFYDNLIVLDSLEHVDMQTCFPYWGFEKVPECMKLVESVAAKFRVSSKVQKEGSLFDEYRWITALGKVVNSDVIQLANSSAPLSFFKGTTDRIRFFAENDVPIQFAPGPTKGLTCPVTVAGGVVANNAETISGMVMAQLVKPGTRAWAASMMLTPNMVNGMPAFGDVGQSLQEAVFNQVWRSYNIPCVTWSGSWTNSMVMDYQAGYELSMNAMLSSLTGASVVTFFGALNAQLSAHPAKAIIDNDIVGIIKRIGEGVLVNKETLATDVINEVGPMPGSFIDHDHTFDWWRHETYIPSVANRMTRKQWVDSGKKNTLDLARDKMEDILKNYKYPQLTESQENEIEYILNDARQYYRKNGMISEEEWAVYQEDINSPKYPFE